MKVKCPDGTVQTPEWCRQCNKCLPKPIKNSLLPKARKSTYQSAKIRFGVTSVVNTCLRSEYYSKTQEKEHSLDTLWLFSRGHAFHNHFDFNQKEIFVKKSFSDFDIIGFVDAIHDGVLYEIKTVSTMPEKPQKRHALQAQAYFSMLPDDQQIKIDKILIVYLSMNSIQVFEIPRVDISPLLQERGKLMADALKNKIAPKPERSYLCNYCDFVDLCDAAGNGSQKTVENNGQDQDAQ